MPYVMLHSVLLGCAGGLIVMIYLDWGSLAAVDK